MTIVYDQSVALAGTDDGDGNVAFNFRAVIKAAVLGAAIGNQIRLTLLFGTACTTTTGTLINVYVGRAAVSGNAYDFNGNQVKVLFGGVGTINASASAVFVSDWITLGEAYDNTKNYVVSIKGGVGQNFSVSVVGLTNVDISYDGGEFGDNAALTTTTLANTAVNTAFLITKIEIQAGAGVNLMGQIWM